MALRITRPRVYVRREPERSVLHQVVREHVATFAAEMEARGDDHALPAFVRRELERFVTCGVLSAGFARFRCASCGAERLVAHSCKGRGFCPSCLGRRMVRLSAHLVDRVLPFVPVRQYVLSLPFELRFRLAFDHDLCRAVLAVFTRALHGFYRDRARARDHRGGRTGSVTVIQRTGSALNCNPHLHTLVLDGVFTEREPGGELRFHPARAPTDRDIARLLNTVRTRIVRLLVRRGVLAADSGEPADDGGDELPPLAELCAASVSGRAATGARAGQRLIRLRSAATVPERAARRPRHAHLGGFDLHASAAVRARSRRRLERLCRYLLRPPVPESRLSLSEGRVLLELKRPFADGSSHVLFEKSELLERLAVLVPRPHKNLLLYHGVLAGNARLRARAVAYGRPESAAQPPAKPTPCRRKRPNPTWAELMRRGLDLDVLSCPRCGARMELVATILGPAVARRILEHLALPSEPVTLHPARAPPDPAEDAGFDPDLAVADASPTRARLERARQRLLP